jgi:1-deoxy-D-xylulose-5-phosphate synthase
MAPSDAEECRQMLTTGLAINGPSAVRYPRGAAPGIPSKELKTIPVGKGEVRRQGRGVAILAFGAMLKPALEAGEVLDATVVNMRFVKPLDTELLKQIADSHHLIVTVEEHQVMGGAGSAVCEALASRNKKVLVLGLPDRFVDHGDPGKLLSSLGLDGDGIRNSIEKAMSE